MDGEAMLRVRLKTTSNPNRAFAHLADLINNGMIRRALVIAQFDDGEVSVVGQRANVDSMAELLMIGAETLSRVPPTPGAKQPKATTAPSKKPAPHTIAACWESLSAEVLDADTPETQRNDMRRAFYGGVLSLFDLMIDTLDPSSDDATPADMARLDGWKEELDRFGHEMQAGRA